jgi:hypothetical protein
VLTIYPLQPERWFGRQAALSPADGEVIGEALYQTGILAAAQPWFERIVAKADEATCMAGSSLNGPPGSLSFGGADRA